MCLIIQHTPTVEGQALSDDEVRDIYSRNRDGFGFMWVENAQLHTRKGVPANVDEAIGWYRDAASRPGVVVVHWRMATHGAVRHELAHPFLLSSTAALVHNGVLSSWGNTGRNDVSDTSEFASAIATWLAQYGHGHRHPTLTEWIDKEVKGSAVVTMGVGDDGLAEVHRHGNVGVNHKDRWYSNTYAWSGPPRPVASWWSRPADSMTTGRYTPPADSVTSWWSGPCPIDPKFGGGNSLDFVLRQRGMHSRPCFHVQPCCADGAKRAVSYIGETQPFTECMTSTAAWQHLGAVAPAPAQNRPELIRTQARSVRRRRQAHKPWTVAVGEVDGERIVARLDPKRSPGWDCCQVLSSGPITTVADWVIDHVAGPDLRWYLGDHDAAIVSYGLDETARILSDVLRPMGYGVRWRPDRDGLSGSLSVVESWEVSDPNRRSDNQYELAMAGFTGR